MTADTDRTRRRFVLDEGVALLTRTPPVLDAWLRHLPDGWLAAHEGGHTWSPHDVVGHLIHGERSDWMDRVRRILETGDTIAFARVNRLAQFGDTTDRPLGTLLDEFAELRRGTWRT